ncbi:cellulose synthase (UDP-forming) [Microvirga guangxiensis]|uniref:Cellulose synthase (UDP-forming) n=2 Tax=Microvirga guangxiensis TaxID=549386 RepID=A0A1G5IYH3_9HYPH|nr:cellulose synthase (UDP-forming) [Microvirga guangxiensis]
MLVLDQDTSSLAGLAVVIGLALLLLPLASPKNAWVRILLLGLTAFLGWRYMLWRITETVPSSETAGIVDVVFGWTFVGIEALCLVSSTLAYMFLTRRKDRHEEADRNLGWWGSNPPRIDLYIATYNEELEVLERTLAGAQALDYPNVRVFVLDDGRREWLAEVCKRYGAEHRTRPHNNHAKAGNINYTLLQRLKDEDAPDFVAVLDADFVPHRNFVRRAVALFHDPSVGLVQTPQHFFNPDPIQHNLYIASAYPDEQRFFFEHLEPARDAWGIAVCCGTSSMVRVSALKEIGGLPTESVTEDFLLTIRLDSHGYRTIYLNEALTEGLAPEGLHEYVVQRGRWCLGMMEIVRNVYNPLTSTQLRFMQRVSLLDSALFWTTTFPFRLISLVCPLLYWYFGIIVVEASLTDITSYYLPYYAAVLITLNWISGGLIWPVLNDVSQLIAAWPITRAAAMGLFVKGPHKFRVTAKGGDRTKTVVQWPMMKPFAIFFGLTVLGLLLPLMSETAFTNVSRAGDGIRIILFWTIYNLLVLAITMLVCVERPRANRPQRESVEMAMISVGMQRFHSWVLELGVDHARVRGLSGLTAGALGTINLNDVGDVAVRVAAETNDGYHLTLRPTSEQRDAILRKLHTADLRPGAGKGDLPGMLRGWMRNLAAR